MDTIASFASKISPPSSSDKVHKDDCMYCFQTCFDPDGLDICLHCYQSFCPSHAGNHYAAFPDHQLYLNYQKRLKPDIANQKRAVKVAKLEIKEKNDDELFDLLTKLYNAESQQYIEYIKEDLPMSIEMSIDGIIKARSSEKKEEIKAWEQEIIVCQHSSNIQQNPMRTVNLEKCVDCKLKENLWICLECGFLGCGREQFGGIAGNSHAKTHAESSGHAVAVKLGSLTYDSADAYCYSCDDEVKVPDLSKLLKTFDINIADIEKTEKSLTELQLEQNIKWEFNMDNSSGEALKPLFGPKLTGFKNLGNSCYLASVLQVIFSFDSFVKEFADSQLDFTNKTPDRDLRTQLIKVATGLVSGHFSVPDLTTTEAVKYQRGVRPSSFKSLVGEDHPEFGSMKQQDASEFWGFLMEKIDNLFAENLEANPANIFKFVCENKLSSDTGDIKLNRELHSSLSLSINAGKLKYDEPEYEPVTFEEMLESWCAPENIELSGKQLIKTSGFKSCPEVLVINVERIQLVNWVPTKVEAPIKISESLDLSPFLAKGIVEGENLVEEYADETDSSQAWIPRAEAFDQLAAMGFPEQRCLKALYHTGNSSADDAMNWLFQHMEDPDIDTPFQFSADSNDSIEAPSDLVEQIESMGFSKKLSIKALVLNQNDPDRAISWIFDNPGDDGELSSIKSTAGLKKSSDKEILDMLVSKTMAKAPVYKLHAIICHKGSSVHSGHYVCFIKKYVDGNEKWVLFNDEKVVVSDATNIKEMESSGYMYLYVKV